MAILPLLIAAATSPAMSPVAAQEETSSAPPAAVTAADPVPATIDACYVPVSGTMYRIDTPASPAAGAPKACLSTTHMSFTWNRQGATGPVGPAGPKGEKGDKGEPGGAASIGPDLTLPGALSMGKTGTFGGGLLAGSVAPLTTPSGAGTRLMWIPQSAAFRAGHANGDEWDPANVGLGSIALGLRTRATQQAAFAAGADVSATGIASVALGNATMASGPGAVALGIGNVASGDHSLALGSGARASGIHAVAIGRGTRATAGNATALGDSTTASASGATALGARTRATAEAAFAAGADVQASGIASVALGNAGVASGTGAVAIGLDVSAGGRAAVAIGESVSASGAHSVVLGRSASSNGKTGAFVFGDRPPGASGNVLQAGTDNEFLVRASGGVRLRTSPNLAAGCNIDPSGNLACTGTVTGTNTGSAAIGPDLTLPGALSMGKTGTFGGGVLATGTNPLAVPSGAGARMMWVPQKFAFRAGQASGSEWDEGSIGPYSAAFGAKAQASGSGAFAAGGSVTASGANAVALGLNTVASGDASVALGRNVSTNGKAGAFVFGDNSTAGQLVYTSPDADNQFLVRASGGVRLRTSSDLSKGCDVGTDGALSCSGGIRATGETIVFVTGDELTVPPQAVANTIAVACPNDYLVIGGGASMTSHSATAAAEAHLSESYPDHATNRWRVRVHNGSALSREVYLRAYAVCIRR